MGGDDDEKVTKITAYLVEGNKEDCRTHCTNSLKYWDIPNAHTLEISFFQKCRDVISLTVRKMRQNNKL